MKRLWAALVAAAACTATPDVGDAGQPPGDAGTDAGLDAGVDAGADAGRDAGPDAGRDAGTDAGVDGGRTCASFILCDDFEANDAGTVPAGWTFSLYPTGGGTALVDTTRAVSGTRSVKVSSLQSAVFNSTVQIRHALTLPTNAYFGRMRVFLPRTPSPHHWNLIESWGYLPNTARVAANEILYQYGGSVQIGSPMLPDAGHTLSAYYLSDSTDCEQSSLGWLPVQQWVCVEWQFDGVNNEMRFWKDGDPVDDLTITSNRTGCGGVWTAPVFERLDLGWYNVQEENGTPMELWIDDVAIDSARIYCQP